MNLDDYEYNIEIDSNSPRSEQPLKIISKLKPHQLACLYKAIKLEKTGYIKYNIDRTNNEDYFETSELNYKIDFKSNIGIIGDIVGYGKTLTALSIVASVDVNDIHINNVVNRGYNVNDAYSYFTYSRVNNNIIKENIINSTLIIVPRGPVYAQWEKSLKENTTLKFLAISNLNFIKKFLPAYKNNNYLEVIKYFNEYDVVLIKNTTLECLLSYYSNRDTIDRYSGYPIINRWKRIMIDEAHELCSKIPNLYYYQLWLISGSYKHIIYNINAFNKILSKFRNQLSNDIIDLMSIKCKKEFVQNSFRIPAPIEKYYLCKLNKQVNIIKNFISQSVLDKINANDISGAIKELGGKSETENNLIELVSKEIKKDITNKEKEREYVSGLDIPIENKSQRLKNIDSDIAVNKDKLLNLTKRVSEFDNKLCGICIDLIDNPVLLECNHSYCATCLISWMEYKTSNLINNNKNCPECRLQINPDKIIAIVKNKEKECSVENEITVPEQLKKEDMLLHIIKNNPTGKFIIFSNYDNNFMQLISLLRENQITSSELKGHTTHMCNVLDNFQKGNIKVILLNSYFAGSGIDISYATDIIIFHNMGLNKIQAVGRAQRVGRKDYLTIHNLCYEHEMPIET